ncbi:hypothetical protein BIW11_05239 [Tropilaelaps mercedesae]|uniref:Uncharacterized protein n=1 Tax=Tropilaelaps mercedesae TaxID=418985 RepID=A0A1V9Y388_9ACAR|nr:hypothetical protein BIW11_05239 [Tropilaelaps mercedesae]
METARVRGNVLTWHFPMMKLSAVYVLLLLTFSAQGERRVKAADAVAFAIVQAKIIRPSAHTVKDRGVTKPGPDDRWLIQLAVDGEQCEMDIAKLEPRIGFTIEGPPFEAIRNEAKDCVLCC